MKLDTIITEKLSHLQLWTGSVDGIEAAVEEFEQTWKAMGRELLEHQIQLQVEAVENEYQGSHQRRARQYQSPLGQLKVTRRVYRHGDGWECKADEELGLPADGWFRSVKELSSALGVSTDFAHATALLARWSGVSVSDKSLANHVEGYGEALCQSEADVPTSAGCPLVSSVSAATCAPRERPVLYIGADGIHTPLQHGVTREAKVGVLFWRSEHRRLCTTRKAIRTREYIATLESVEQFRDQLNARYALMVNNKPHQVVVLGDGAAWIWLMAQMLFPQCIEIPCV